MNSSDVCSKGEHVVDRFSEDDADEEVEEISAKMFEVDGYKDRVKVI